MLEKGAGDFMEAQENERLCTNRDQTKVQQSGNWLGSACGKRSGIDKIHHHARDSRRRKRQRKT